MAAVHGRPEATFSEAARKTLLAYDWPGNVRELKNAIERALVFANKPVLAPEDFPENIRAADSGAARAVCARSKRSSSEAIQADSGGHALQNHARGGDSGDQPQDAAR